MAESVSRRATLQSAWADYWSDEETYSITQMRATQYQADQADQQSRRRTERLLDDMGTPSSVYRSGSYESRTYQSGNTIQTIRMKDGKITGSSTYRSNR